VIFDAPVVTRRPSGVLLPGAGRLPRFKFPTPWLSSPWPRGPVTQRTSPCYLRQPPSAAISWPGIAIHHAPITCPGPRGAVSPPVTPAARHLPRSPQAGWPTP